MIVARLNMSALSCVRTSQPTYRVDASHGSQPCGFIRRMSLGLSSVNGHEMRLSARRLGVGLTTVSPLTRVAFFTNIKAATDVAWGQRRRHVDPAKYRSLVAFVTLLRRRQYLRTFDFRDNIVLQ